MCQVLIEATVTADSYNSSSGSDPFHLYDTNFVKIMETFSEAGPQKRCFWTNSLGMENAELSQCSDSDSESLSGI